MQAPRLRTEAMLELEASPQRSRSNQVVPKLEMVVMLVLLVLQTQRTRTEAILGMRKRFPFDQQHLAP
jgi:hypothetical protein